MDERFIEMAGENEEKLREARARMTGAKALPDTDLTPEQYKRLDCETCGDDLPEFRLKKGCTKCTSCQDAAERAQKRKL